MTTKQKLDLEFEDATAKLKKAGAVMDRAVLRYVNAAMNVQRVHTERFLLGGKRARKS